MGFVATGGSLVIAAPGGEKDTQYLARLCKEHDVSSCTFVPSQWDAMLRVSTTLQSYGCNCWCVIWCGWAHGKPSVAGA